MHRAHALDGLAVSSLSSADMSRGRREGGGEGGRGGGGNAQWVCRLVPPGARSGLAFQEEEEVCTVSCGR